MNPKLPTADDVILGRGGRSNRHDGNRKFREEVNHRKADYAAAVKRDKAAIAEEIVKKLRARGVRFLKQIERGNDSSWEDVGDATAKQKTSQALRENPEKEAQRKRLRLEASSSGDSQTQSSKDRKPSTPKITNSTPGRHSHHIPEMEFHPADRQRLHERMDRSHYLPPTNIPFDATQVPPLPPDSTPYYPQRFYDPYHSQRHHSPDGYYNTPNSHHLKRIDPLHDHHPHHNRRIPHYATPQIPPPLYFQGQAQTPQQQQTPQLNRPTNVLSGQTKMSAEKSPMQISSEAKLPPYQYNQPYAGIDRRVNNSLDSEDLPVGPIDMADFSNLFDPDDKEEDDPNQASAKREISEHEWNQSRHRALGEDHDKSNAFWSDPSFYKKGR